MKIRFTILHPMKYGQVATEKLYFSSSEAAEQIGVPVDILHSWEKKHPELNPKKNANGKRIYKQSDIETAKEIKGKVAGEEGFVVDKPPVDKPPRQTKTTPKAGKDSRTLIKIRNKLQNVLENIKNQK